MNLIKLGDCWINPKHISCAKIEETLVKIVENVQKEILDTDKIRIEFW